MLDYNQVLMLLDQFIPQTAGFPGLMQMLVFVQGLLMQISTLPGGFLGF